MYTTDNKKEAVGVFNDLRKAFHTEDKKILIINGPMSPKVYN